MTGFSGGGIECTDRECHDGRAATGHFLLRLPVAARRVAAVGSSSGLSTMRLRSDEIDPQVAHKLSAFLRERWDRSRAEVSRAWSVLFARVIAPFAVFMALLLTAAIPGLGPLILLLALPAMLAVWLGGIVYFRRVVSRRGATDVLTPGTVRLASEARSLTPPEKGYAALLQALLSSSPSLGEATVRGILPPLNELLQNARDLDTQQQRLLLPVGDTTIASLVQQRDDLAPT